MVWSSVFYALSHLWGSGMISSCALHDDDGAGGNVWDTRLTLRNAQPLLRVIAKDAADYERIHTQHLTQLPGISRVRSSFSLRTVVKKNTIPIR